MLCGSLRPPEELGWPGGIGTVLGVLETIWSLVTMETAKALGSLICEMGVGSGPVQGGAVQG